MHFVNNFAIKIKGEDTKRLTCNCLKALINGSVLGTNFRLTPSYSDNLHNFTYTGF